jgi:signal transduction histidine kinase
MNLLRSSLRNKLIALALVPTLVLLTVYGLLAYRVAQQGLEDELGARLIAIGQVLSADLSGGLDAQQLERLDPSKERVRKRLSTRLERAQQMTGARRIFLFDRQLNSLIDTDPNVQFGQRLYALEVDRVEIERVVDERRPAASVLFTDEQGTRYKNAYVPVFLDAEHTRVVAVLGVEASASYFALLTTFARGLVVIALVGGLLVVLIAVWFARALVRPVNQLVAAANNLGAGDLTTPIAASADGDELTSLARSFEQMRQNVLGRDQQLQMMLSGIAHEVRNPLGGMELFVGLLREDLTWSAEGEARDGMLDKVAKIERELHYLERVVTDFLDFARHKPPELERFGARGFIDEIAALMAAQAEECGSVLETRVEDEALELVAERDTLRRALINIVRNGLQACPRGGTVTLEAREAGEGWRAIEVRDTGCGISAAQLEQVMTPFYTTKEKGSGLGLALTRKIVEQHGGRLELESEVGVGTCVRLVWPFDASAPKQAAAAIPEGWLG